MLALTRRWVEVNSFTTNIAGVAQVGALLRDAFALPSLALTAIPADGYAEHLVWRTPAAMTKVLASMMMSPRLSLVVERGQAVAADAGGCVPLHAHELATRLSLHFWDTAPDAALAAAADDASLLTPAVLQAQVPQRFLTQLCLTGDPIDAARAREIGLINDVADDLDAALERLLTRLLSNSPTALRRGLYAMKAMRSMSFEEAIAFGEGQIGLLAMTQDAREGIAAFKDKRKPQWAGK